MIRQAIKNLYPDASFAVEGDEYKFLDETVYSEEDIQAEITRLEAEYEAKEYQRLREKEYPSYADQFDMIFHEGVDAWKAKIQEVKDKYPKPGN
jgi:hypothetical protein